VKWRRQTHVELKNSIFWNITPCSALKVDRRFGGTCRSRLHGRRIRQAGSKQSLHVRVTFMIFAIYLTTLLVVYIASNGES
jgi:hypothetical protein